MALRRWLPYPIAALALFAACSALRATNLLQNGTFDTSMAPWTPVNSAALDATDGNPPGSLQLFAGLGLSCSSATSECINASTPAALEMRADNDVPSAISGIQVNQVRLLTYTSLNCTSPGPILVGPDTGPSPPTNVWQALSGIALLPAGTRSLQLQALLCVPGSTTLGGVSRFDNISLRPAYYVFNPHFAGPIRLLPWVGPELTFDATRDASGDPTSGSAQVTSTSTASCSIASQCLLTKPGPLDLEAKILLPGSNTAPGQAEVQYVFTADSSCDPATTLGTEILGPVSGPPDTWTALSLTGVAAPPGTQAVLVELRACAASAGTFAANFDDVLADPPSVTEIPTLGVRGLAALGALLLGTALLALGRMARRRLRN